MRDNIRTIMLNNGIDPIRYLIHILSVLTTAAMAQPFNLATKEYVDALSLTNHADVVVTGTPADNEALAWNTATGKWINQGGDDEEIELQISKGKSGTVPAILDLSGLFDYWTFNGTTDNSAKWVFVMPADYVADAEPVVDIYWMSDGTTGNVEWEVTITAVTDGEALETATAGNITTTTTAVPGTAGLLDVVAHTIADADDDALAAGDMVVIEINRDASADTNNDDAHLTGVTFTYTP